MWNVIGQPIAVELLKQGIASGRLSHAYLFAGPPHTGKTTLALSLAQALNCEAEDRPCGTCGACLRIASGRHADVQIIGRLSDAANGEAGPKKEIAIGQIRELQQAAALRPYEGRHRVFIIDSAEYLNEESANCLLKTLEEPPPDVLIILIAANDAVLLPTIVSRCQRIELRPVPAATIEEELTANRNVAPEKAKALSRLCRGGIGWALTAATDVSVLEERSSRLDELQELATAGLERRFEYAAVLATRYSKNRDAVAETLGLWLDWWRDLLLVKAGCTGLITNADREETLVRCAGDYRLADIRGFIEALRAAMRHLEQNANARLALEVLMLGVPDREERVGQPGA